MIAHGKKVNKPEYGKVKIDSLTVLFYSLNEDYVMEI